MITITFTQAELDLLLEALQHRASRHVSMSRYNPRSAGPHDRAVQAMDKLRSKLLCMCDEEDI